MTADVIFAVLGGWIVTAAIHSSFLLGGVWFAERIGLLRNLALRETCWKAALLGSLVTAILQTTFPIRPLAILAVPAPGGGATAAVEAVTRSAPEAAMDLLSSWPAVLTAFWVIGVFASLVRIGRRVAMEHAGLRQRRIVLDGFLVQSLDELARRTGCGRLPVLSVSRELNAPVTLPSGEICLPQWSLEQLSHAQLKAVIAHELAHVVRRDPQWLLFTKIAEGILFFQILLPLARRRLIELGELQADAWAAGHTRDARSLAESLTLCAERIQSYRMVPLGSAMASNGSLLRRRVTRLVDGDPSDCHVGAWRRHATAGCLGVAAIFITPCAVIESGVATAHVEADRGGRSSCGVEQCRIGPGEVADHTNVGSQQDSTSAFFGLNLGKGDSVMDCSSSD